jgi:hypothetical protein
MPSLAIVKRLGWLVPVALGLTACGVDRNGEQFVGDEAGVGAGLGSSSGSSSGAARDAGGMFGNGDPSDDGGSFVSPGDGGPVVRGDAGPQCDYGGRWATKITIPVSWMPQGITSIILAPGTGTIEQWILSDRTVSGLSTSEVAQVCGIALPDFQSTGFVGAGEVYGVRFPDSLFDKGFIPSIAFDAKLGDLSPTASYKTQPTAVLIGLALQNATTAAWPSFLLTAEDIDGDNQPGVTANTASGPISSSLTGALYSAIPTDISFDRANQVFVAIRQVTALSGSAIDCDHIAGTVSIPVIQDGSTANGTTGKAAIDSHVVGCALVDGGTCSTEQTAFVDGTQPVFTPTGRATFTSTRMAGDCASVRRAFP